MKKHWYKYSVIALISINVVTYALYFLLPEIQTDCNGCSSGGWCTLKACPTISEIAGQFFNLFLVVSVPLLLLLTLVKAIFIFRAKRNSRVRKK